MRRRVYLFYWLFITRPEWDCHKSSERNAEYQFLLLAIETSKGAFKTANAFRPLQTKQSRKKVGCLLPSMSEDTPFAHIYRHLSLFICKVRHLMTHSYSISPLHQKVSKPTKQNLLLRSKCSLAISRQDRYNIGKVPRMRTFTF